MYLMVLRNPELNNAVWTWQVDRPLLGYEKRKKYKISRVYRTKENDVAYQMSTDERIRNIISDGFRGF